MYENKRYAVRPFSHRDPQDELCGMDHKWECSVKVHRSVMVSNGPYCEILKERKEEKNLDSQHCTLSSNRREDP
jgi:hypothetical protein